MLSLVKCENGYQCPKCCVLYDLGEAPALKFPPQKKQVIRTLLGWVSSHGWPTLYNYIWEPNTHHCDGQITGDKIAVTLIRQLINIPLMGVLPR